MLYTVSNRSQLVPSAQPSACAILLLKSTLSLCPPSIAPSRLTTTLHPWLPQKVARLLAIGVLALHHRSKELFGLSWADFLLAGAGSPATATTTTAPAAAPAPEAHAPTALVLPAVQPVMPLVPLVPLAPALGGEQEEEQEESLVALLLGPALPPQPTLQAMAAAARRPSFGPLDSGECGELEAFFLTPCASFGLSEAEAAALEAVAEWTACCPPTPHVGASGAAIAPALAATPGPAPALSAANQWLVRTEAPTAQPAAGVEVPCPLPPMVGCSPPAAGFSLLELEENDIDIVIGLPDVPGLLPKELEDVMTAAEAGTLGFPPTSPEGPGPF